MPTNTNLAKAKAAKNDEFYTQIDDVIKEIIGHPDYYKNFEGKTVYMNCDNPEFSQFFRFFRLFFKKLKLKKIISTHYNKDGSPSYKMEWSGEKLKGDTVNMIKTPLEGSGDFYSEECIELLKEADIIVTNPPFSQFREFIALLMKYEKKFLIIGNMNAVIYKSIFPLITNNKVKIGYSHITDFFMPDQNIKKIPATWYTNLEIDKRHEPLILTKSYKGNEDKYPKYDNFDAINCDRIADIPKDYFGVMGVPITFLDKYCPEQFEILGILHSSTDEQAGIPNLRYYGDFKEMRQDMTYTGASGSKSNGYPMLKGKPAKGNFLHNKKTNEYVYSTYARIVIQRKPQ